MSSIKHFGRKRRRADDDSSPGCYSMEGRPVLCPHCSGDQFKAGEAQLNTALATLLELDWIKSITHEGTFQLRPQR